MRTTITRRLTQSTIYPVKVDFVNGQPTTEPLEPITVYGNVTAEQAKKTVTTKYGKASNVVVAKIESAEKQFEISVDDFVKHAKIVEDETATEAEAI